jgi:transposase
MAKELIDDKLWEIVEPLLPKPKKRRFRFPGRKPVGNREALTGILFVLKSGISWEMLPREMGCGCGMTCWRRLRDWQKAGVWDRIKQVLLDSLGKANNIDWGRAVADASYVRAVGGGEKTGPNPTDRGKMGSKHSIVTDARGLPLVVMLTAANVNDTVLLDKLIDAIPPIKAPIGRPKRHPLIVQGDRGYDSEDQRRKLRARGMIPQIAKRGTEHGSGLGVFRWVVERTISWLHQYKRLRVRWERLAIIHEAFLTIGCILIIWKTYVSSLC